MIVGIQLIILAMNLWLYMKFFIVILIGELNGFLLLLPIIILAPYHIYRDSEISYHIGDCDCDNLGNSSYLFDHN